MATTFDHDVAAQPPPREHWPECQDADGPGVGGRGVDGPGAGDPAVDGPNTVGLERPSYLGERPRSRAWSALTRVSVPLALLGLWWWGTAVGFISEDVLASPTAVLGALEELIETGQLVEFVGASLRRAGLGVLFGVTVGLLLGVVSGLWRLGEELLDPTMQMKRAVPFLALVPLFISWFGVDETFKVVLIAVSAAGPMYGYTYVGVRNVDRKVVEAARQFGLRGPRLAREVIIPGALPNVLMALRICLGISVTGLIAAEAIGTTAGIGYLVQLSQTYFRKDYMVLCIVLYALLGLAVDGVVRLIERWAMPWRRHTTVRG